MAAKIAILFALCCVTVQAGMVRRDAPAAQQPNYLEDITKHATDFSSKFSEEISKYASAKNTEDFTKVFKENADTIIAQLSQFSTDLNKALVDANGKAKETISEAAQKLDQTVQDLKKKNPQVEQQSKEFGDKIKSAVQQAVQEGEKVAKRLSENTQELSEKVAPSIKTAYDDFVKQAEQVQKNLHEAANKA